MADISAIKLPDGNTYDLKDASKSSATNWVNGSATGSVRTVSSKVEDDNYTMGTYAVAEGHDTKASGNFGSHAEGASTVASANGAHAEGLSTTSSNYGSHAEGANTTASGLYSHAEGYQTIARGEAAHAEGAAAKAYSKYSHAEGMNTEAYGRSQHVFGENNIVDNAQSSTNRATYVEIVGNGTDSSNLHNARTLDWSGNEVLAGKLTVGVAGTNSMDVATVGQIPNVPSWAMASAKPTYTASEVGALPSTTSIPTKTSDLTNDGDGTSAFATMADIGSLGGGTITQVQTTAGAHTAVNVTSGAVSFNVPTKTSHLTNDSGFITSDSDEKVKQISESDNANALPILFSRSTDSSTVTGDVGKISTFYIKPYYGLLHVAKMHAHSLFISQDGDFSTGSNNYIQITQLESTLNNKYTVKLQSKSGTLALISDIPDVSGFITSETDPVFSASAAAGITATDISNWNNKTSNTGTVTQVTAGTGLKIGNATSGGNITTSGTINHINSVTAQTTQAVYPIKIDAQGHISGYGSAVTSMPASDVSAWAKAASKPTYTASEVGAVPTTREINGYPLSSDLTMSSDTIPTTFTNGEIVFEELGYTYSTGSLVQGALEAFVDVLDHVGLDKQDTLTSGTNIKTINNQSLLGSGNISITETDPTVPSWAKASTKPSYTASEVGAVSDVQLDGTSVVSGTVANIPTSDIFDVLYPVGSCYTTSTNSNPSSYLGGTWTLIDKVFSPLSENDTGITWNNTYTQDGTNADRQISWSRNGHQIFIRLRWYNKVAFSDSEQGICTINMNTLGIASGQSNYWQHFFGFSDGVNAILGMYCAWNGSSLNVFVEDAISRAATIPSTTNQQATAFLRVHCNISDMDDDACDQFIWKRTA